VTEESASSLALAHAFLVVIPRTFVILSVAKDLLLPLPFWLSFPEESASSFVVVHRPAIPTQNPIAATPQQPTQPDCAYNGIPTQATEILNIAKLLGLGWVRVIRG